MKVLIIRFSSIGDIVLTTPVIRCLKKQLNVELHYVTKRKYISIIEPNPYLDKIWSFQNRIQELFEALKKEQFDYIIDLHKNLRSFHLKQILKVQAFSFNKLNWEKWLMTQFKINQLPKIHIVDRYMKSVESLNVVNDNQGLDFFITKEDEVEVEQFLQSIKCHLKEEYIAIVIGATYFTKRPTLQLLTDLSNQLTQKIILIGGPEDQKRGEEIIHHSNHKNIYNSCGFLSIRASATLIQNAEWVITPDTGMMHIAAAFHKKIISIWGNTMSDFGMFPYFPNNFLKTSILIENKEVSCRPCSKIGYDACPKKHFKCIRDLDINQIIETINLK